MRVNYFVLYPDNTYEFVEKESTFSELNFCKAIEDSVGDFCYFSPITDYPGYFIAFNDCTANYSLNNTLASSLTNRKEYDICAIVKALNPAPCSDIEFDAFNEDDKKLFDNLLKEQIKAINNEF